MKAVQFAELGPPEVLTVVDVEAPHAGPGQIRVAARASGVNPVDWKIRGGSSRRPTPIPLPSIPGMDVAGVVDEVGEGVVGTAIGAEVFGEAIGGGAAEYVVLENFALKPAAMSWAEAGGLASATETALRALDLLGVTPGSTLLINGAAGGVGVAAAQFAVARGASVIGTASESNHPYLRSIGVTPTLYGIGLPGRVKRLTSSAGSTGNGGFRFALDVAGKGALAELIEVTGSVDQVLTLSDPEAERHGVRYSTGAEGRSWPALRLAAELFESGRFSMPVERTFTLEQAAQAHRISEMGHVRGKLVLIID